MVPKFVTTPLPPSMSTATLPVIGAGAALSVGGNSACRQVDPFGVEAAMPPFDRPEVGDGPRISGRAVDGVVIVGRCLIGDVPGRRYRRRIAEHDAVDVGSGDNDS